MNSIRLGVKGIDDRYALKLRFSRGHRTLELTVLVGWSVSLLIHPLVMNAYVFFSLFRFFAFFRPPTRDWGDCIWPRSRKRYPDSL